MTEIPIENIDPNPFQTRRDFDEQKIRELAESIKKVDLLQKILLRPHPEVEGRYQIAHGERRLRAFKHLGLKTIPAEIRELSDQDLAEIVVIENTQRADLNAIEEAQGYQTLIDLFSYSKADLGRKIGKSRSYISNSIRLLKMPFFLKACVLCKTVSVWHSRVIMGLPEGYAKYVMADLVMDWHLSVDETRTCVNDIKNGNEVISCVRDVPIKGLKEGYQIREIMPLHSSPEKVSILNSMKDHGQMVPITVDTTGTILDGHIRTQCGRQLGWETIRAEVIYFTKNMKDRGGPPWAIGVRKCEEGDKPGPGIGPELTEEQSQNMKKLVTMLEYAVKRAEKQIQAEEEAPAQEATP